jgi:hypothetical protein
LTAGDCALVLQLRQQILSKMSVQVTKDIEAADCFEELQSMGAPRLAVVALVPVQEAP